MKTGVILIVIGAFFLLREMGLLAGIDMNIAWPVALIVLGAWMVIRKKDRCKNCGECHDGVCPVERK
jgi:hypothetical protein